MKSIISKYAGLAEFILASGYNSRTAAKTPYPATAQSRRAARRAFSRSFAFFCFSADTNVWQASHRFRIRERVMNSAAQRRHFLVMVSSRGRIPGFLGKG